MKRLTRHWTNQPNRGKPRIKNEFHGPERMGNDMDWKIGPKQTIWTKYGPIRNAKMQYGNVTPI